MDWQTVLTALFVTVAAAYLVRSGWRTWFGAKPGCSGGCSCSGSAKQPNAGRRLAAFVPVTGLTLRRRDREAY
jgi:hypothetical protein